MEEQLQVAILLGANEEEIEQLLLHNIIGVEDEQENNLVRPVEFELNNMTDEEITTNFRFSRMDITRLKNALGLPNRIVTETGNNVNGITALCMLLRRLSYPNRLHDLKRVFNYSSQSLSQVIKTTSDFIIETHGHLLDSLNAHQWLDRNRYQQYAQAIRNMGGAIQNCWGFIDGTIRPICRPSVQQEEYYSGHKRVHCVKYQSVLCPDGLIINLKRAFPGRRHDAGILRNTDLYEQLEENAVFPNHGNYVLYGDQAYGIRPLLYSPYPGQPANLLDHQIAFNNSMKVLRVAVEWGFQKVLSIFAFVDFKKNQKLLLNDIENWYKCAVILTNCHTCLYGNQTAEYFNILPPQLEEYVGCNN